MKNKTIILNYHKIVSAPDKGFENHYDISLESFKKQILYLVHQKFNFVLPEAMDELKENSQSNVILTFDDGNLSDYYEVVPFLHALKIPALFFINTSKSKLKPEMMKEMVSLGFKIGSHGVHHDPLSWLTEKEQFVEIQSSKWKLEHTLDTPINYFAFPHGDYNRRLLKMCKMVGYKGVFTTRFKKMKNPAFIMHRLTIKNTLSFDQFKSIMNNSWYSHYLAWIGFSLKIFGGPKKQRELQTKL